MKSLVPITCHLFSAVLSLPTGIYLFGNSFQNTALSLYRLRVNYSYERKHLSTENQMNLYLSYHSLSPCQRSALCIPTSNGRIYHRRSMLSTISSWDPIPLSKSWHLSTNLEIACIWRLTLRRIRTGLVAVLLSSFEEIGSSCAWLWILPSRFFFSPSESCARLVPLTGPQGAPLKRVLR